MIPADYLNTLHALDSATGDPEAQLGPLVKELIEALLGPQVRVELEVRTEVGRPDLGVKDQGLLVGFVELKAPGKGADPTRFRGHDKEQWQKFQSLPNLIYTDGSDFALYRQGERVRHCAAADGDQLLQLWQDFLHWVPQTPGNPQELATFLAPLARFLRDAVVEALEHQPDGALGHLRAEWQTTLLPEADEATFADAYAQLMTYGFLLARMESKTREHLSLEDALGLLESRYGLLMEALFLSNHPRLLSEIRAAYDLLRRSIAAVNPEAFQGSGGDPWLYFYEDFLGAYDPKLRKDMGVYYTPVAVVQAMVRLVDDLLKTRFQKPLGLADEHVTVLDPATGTGTFPLAVLEQALQNVGNRYGEGVRGQYASALAERLYAFEIMVGPYAVAQLRLSQALEAEKGQLPEGGLKLYLSDTLEAPDAPPIVRTFFYDRLAEERKKAAQVKKAVPILVCIGNPPYNRVEGENKAERDKRGGWVLAGHKDPDNPLSPSPFEDFLAPARATGMGIHLRNLYNLYTYFWRWALWKVFEQDLSRPGVLCFITASSYLQGPGFVGMREHLRRELDELYILDLGGEGRGAVREENVFNIQTPVAIAIAVRYGEADREKAAKVYYHRLDAATRERKLAALGSIENFKGLAFQEAPSGWQESFTPVAGGDWATWPLITDLFPWNHNGVKFERTWPIGPTQEVLRERWKGLLSSGNKTELFRESRDRKMHQNYLAILSDATLPALTGLPHDSQPESIQRYAYRSFGRAWAIVDGRVCSYPRPPLWRSRSEQQLYLTSLLTGLLGSGPALTASALVPDLHHFRGSFGGKDILPLYRDATTPNLTAGLLELLQATYGLPVTPEEFAAYTYALLAHPGYTGRFQEELRNPGPRVPLTKDGNLFRQGVALGSELLWLHTYGERYREGRDWSAFSGKARWQASPTTYPEDHGYDESEQALRVGNGKVEHVTPAVWNFQVSGFQPLKAWLGYRQQKRKGKTSSPLDHIQPATWPAELSRELLELVWVLEATLERNPAQAALLEAILEAPLFHLDELPQPSEAEKAPPGASGDPQQDDLFSS